MLELYIYFILILLIIYFIYFYLPVCFINAGISGITKYKFLLISWFKFFNINYILYYKKKVYLRIF